MRHKSTVPAWLSVAAVAVTAMVLRPAATAVGPVLTELSNELGMSASLAGVLTALPGLVFAIAGMTANRVVAYLSPVSALAVACGAIALGSVLRALTGSWSLFLLYTLFALAGMAIGNVLVPAFIKSSFPSASAKVATLYTTALAIGATLPTLLAAPLKELGGWRLSVGIWSILAAVATILWLLAWKHFRPKDSAHITSERLKVWALLRSSTAVALMLFFGLQSMQAYVQFGWLAEVYRSGGLSASSAAIMLAVISAGGIPGGIIMPTIVARKKWLPASIVLFSTLLAIGYAGLALSPTTFPWLWAIALSISGFCFPTALALIIERTRNPRVTSAVSGFVQPYGYLLAAAGPLLVGLFYEEIGAWPPILWGLAACAVPMCIAGLVAARPRIIDDSPSIAGP